ncbi:MarR family winged helix-turn-helix transcriptional regulator [Enterococcus hermanniensis]|nr:MarR family winged helix-turn-helix transcriptional regulator [Enterococcus hermanniensis]
MKTNQDTLSENIYLVNLMQQDFIDTRLKKIGLTAHQARTLNYIGFNPGVIQKKLANYLGKQDATVTNILKVLEKKDYIERKIPVDNERQKNLFLTGRGLELTKEIQQIFADLNNHVTNLLDKEEQYQLKKLLKKIQ